MIGKIDVEWMIGKKMFEDRFDCILFHQRMFTDEFIFG